MSENSRATFVSTQQLVLTKLIDLEKGEQGQHYHFEQGESLPFEPFGVLGSGGFGQVDKVISRISLKEHARKRVLRSAAFRGPRREATRRFISEIQILKRLQHHHIVRLVGSYTDQKYVALIMYPIAQMDLSAYLSRATTSDHPELQTFFGCLATALEFLHEQKVRHKDIKPGNILVNQGTILFTDFGLSLDYGESDQGSMTATMVNGKTPRYCAPEVAENEPRNTKSDIWSLGVVYVEMMLALKGKTIADMDLYFTQHGTCRTFVHTNVDALPEFIGELSRTGKASDNKALAWAQHMLSVKQESRPSAAALVSSITTPDEEESGTSFCGICCIPCEEEFSDQGSG